MIAAPFAPITVRPNSLSYELLLTATTAVSHHDPATQDDSNRVLFNRQKQLLTGPVDVALPDQRMVDDVAAAHPVPETIVDLFVDVQFPEFVASALVKLFLDLYNRGDGVGIFEGEERYSRLEARLRQAAMCSHSLVALWNRLANSLQVPIHPGDADQPLLKLLTLPKGLQARVLRILVEDYRSAVALARLWHGETKCLSPEYAAAAGRPRVERVVELDWDADGLEPGAPGARVAEVPTVTGNSLRHQVVREPAWLHLCQHLDLAPESPGRGPVPPGVEALFYNGGNIMAGAHQPDNAHALAWQIRARYPSLDLLGGVVDSFDLGESRLNVVGWLVCRENARALQGTAAEKLPAVEVSIYDLLDDVTLTRQAGPTGLGQMIFTQETLATGLQIYCRLALAPWTPTLTRGALVAAVETFLAEAPTIGGQAARGFGRVVGEWLSRPDGDEDVRSAYEAYLADNRDELREGLVSGRLGLSARGPILT